VDKVVAYRSDAFASGATFVAAVLLVAAALYLEYGWPRADQPGPGCRTRRVAAVRRAALDLPARLVR
jgi:hypothetical protein